MAVSLIPDPALLSLDFDSPSLICDSSCQCQVQTYAWFEFWAREWQGWQKRRLALWAS